MKVKKLISAVLLLAFLLTGLWLYGNISFPLTDALPKETWTKAQLWHYDENMDSREFQIDEEALSQIVAALTSAKVTHRQSFDSISQPNFHLYLYHGSGYPTSFTIVENGDIAIAIELDTDHYRYFDGGEELYEALYRICQQLPIKKNS